jgi:hypothetical protein
MPFDGSGTYTRPISSWVADATAGIKIRADRHDLQDDDFTNALTLTITRDGQTQPTNNIPLNGHRLINLGDPVNDGDAVSKGWLARTPYQVAGSDVLGRIKFQGTEADAPAGKPMGFEWAQSDMFFGVRKKPATQPPLPAPEVPAKWVWNNKADASGTDVMQLDKTTGMLTMPRLGVTLTIERSPVASNSGTAYGAYLSDDTSAWRFRTVNKAMLMQGNMGPGDGGAFVIYGDSSGAAAVAKDSNVAWETRFTFYRRGGLVITGSEYTYNLLISRPEATAMGSIHNTAGYTGWAQLNYEYSSTYYSYVQLYQAGVAYWGFYCNSAALASGGWTTSDGRLKENLQKQDIDLAVDVVKRIPVVSYTKKTDRVANASRTLPVPVRRTIGWRAQDVRPHLPDAVMDVPVPDADVLTRAALKGLMAMPKEETGEERKLRGEKLSFLAMDDRAMVATLWAATQRLIDRVEKLEAA